MEAVMIKDVEFNGDMLKAVQDVNKIIWVGVKWVCNGIGLSHDQGRAQVKKIQTDLVLSKGCVKFDTGVFDANNEALALQLDYLPLWLAKISITPTMQRENPELVEKLVTYQLKAKDVLAAAFLPQYTESEQQKNYSTIDRSQLDLKTQLMFLMVESISEQEMEQKRINSKITELEAQMSSFATSMTNFSNYIMNKLEKPEESVKTEVYKPSTVVFTANDRNEQYEWKKKMSILMSKLVKLDSRFENKIDIYNYLYDEIQAQYGTCWTQCTKEYKEKYQLTYKPSRIDVCYDDKHLRSIFMSKLEDLVDAASKEQGESESIATIGDMITKEQREEITSALSKDTRFLADIITPLIRRNKDTSLNGSLTYRMVYKHMTVQYGIVWDKYYTRYINQYGKRPAHKLDVIVGNDKLYRTFKKSVENLMNEKEEWKNDRSTTDS